MTSSYPPQPDVTNPSTDAPDRAMKRFGMIQPFVISEESPLSANARFVYMTMTVYAGADRKGVRPGVMALVKHTKLSKRAVIRALNEIEAVGLALAKHRTAAPAEGKKQGLKLPTIYTLLDTDVQYEHFLGEHGVWTEQGGSDSQALGVVPEGHQGGVCETPPLVTEGHHPGVCEALGVVTEGHLISTSDQDHGSAPASSTSDQHQSKATPDARGSAEGSLAKEGRAGAAGDAQADPAPLDEEDTSSLAEHTDPALVINDKDDPALEVQVLSSSSSAAHFEPGDASLADPDLPAEWQTLLVKIDDHLAAQLLPVLDCYWTHLLASGKPRYPDQLSAILSELIMLVQDRRVDEVIAGIEWTFGGSGCNAPHKVEAVRQYVTQRSDSHTVHRLAQEPNASEARQRVLQAKPPRRRPNRALPASLAPSATEAAEKREHLLAMRQRAGGTAQPVSAPDAQPVAETTPYVETRSPELLAHIQATLYRASA